MSLSYIQFGKHHGTAFRIVKTPAGSYRWLSSITSPNARHVEV
jgi:hypothetical protein